MLCFFLYEQINKLIINAAINIITTGTHMPTAMAAVLLLAEKVNMFDCVNGVDSVNVFNSVKVFDSVCVYALCDTVPTFETSSFGSAAVSIVPISYPKVPFWD